jgi:hypothetical protein
MTTRIPLPRSQTRLLVTWGVFATATALIVAVKAHNGMYMHAVPDGAERVDGSTEVWEGLLPMILPTLTLMVGTVAAEARQVDSDATVSSRAYHLSLTLSFVYLTALLVVVLLGPSVSSNEAAITGNPFLLALQGLVGLSLGGFFVSRRARSEADSPEEGGAGVPPAAPPTDR